MNSHVSSAVLRAPGRVARQSARATARRLSTELDVLRTRGGRADLAIFHELAPPPSGGGHQFVRALVRELDGRGLEVELNRISSQTQACLFNSFNFDVTRLQRFARRGARMVHRVDGPIGVYRGFDDGTDAWIANVNAAARVRDDLPVAVLAREASRARARAPRPGRDPERRRPGDLPSALGSGTARGTEDPTRRDELVGQPAQGRRHARLARPQSRPRALRGDVRRARADGSSSTIHVVGPLDSHALAALLRTQDVYLAPSYDDPCSNALLEALACGLPAAFRPSGGHPELVGEGGLPFREDHELGDLLDRLVAELDERRAAISTRSISWVADRYLEVLGLRIAA